MIFAHAHRPNHVSLRSRLNNKVLARAFKISHQKIGLDMSINYYINCYIYYSIYYSKLIRYLDIMMNNK